MQRVPSLQTLEMQEFAISLNAAFPTSVLTPQMFVSEQCMSYLHGRQTVSYNSVLSLQ